MIVDAVPSRAAAGVVPSPWMPPAKIPTGQCTRRQRIFGSLAASNLQGGRNQGQSGPIRANQRTSELQRTSDVHQRYIRGHQRPSEPCIRGTRRSSDEAIRGPPETIRCHQRSSDVIRGHQRSSEVISLSPLRPHRVVAPIVAATGTVAPPRAGVCTTCTSWPRYSGVVVS